MVQRATVAGEGGSGIRARFIEFMRVFVNSLKREAPEEKDPRATQPSKNERSEIGDSRNI